VNLNEKRIRTLVREEIIKKHARKHGLSILNEAASEDDITVVQAALRIDEDGDINTVWPAYWRFLQNNYLPLITKDGEDLAGITTEIPSLESVYNDWDDKADNLGYPATAAGLAEFISDGGVPKDRSPAGRALRNQGVRLSQIDIPSSIRFSNEPNWNNDVSLTFDEEGRINDDDDWANLILGVKDSLDFPISDKNIDTVWDVYRALRGHVFYDSIDEENVYALSALARAYERDEGDEITAVLDDTKDNWGRDPEQERKAEKLLDMFNALEEGPLDNASERARAAARNIGDRFNFNESKNIGHIILRSVRVMVKDVLNEGTLGVSRGDIPRRGGTSAGDETSDSGIQAARSDSGTPRSRRHTSNRYWGHQTVKDIQTIVNAPSCATSRGCDGKWGPKTQIAWEAYLTQKFEELGDDWSSVSPSQKWPPMSSIVSGIADKSFSGDPIGALAFLQHLSGVQATREDEPEAPPTEPAETSGLPAGLDRPELTTEPGAPQGRGPFDREVRKQAPGKTIERELFPGSAAAAPGGRVHKYIPTRPIRVDFRGSAISGDERVRKIVVVMDSSLPLSDETAGYQPNGTWVANNSQVSEIRMNNRKYRRNHAGHAELLKWIRDRVGWEHFNV
tara:strand:- start:102 stop:1970 length:1869 start_codon:yes stop_codon:yes gene_type:complete